MSVVIPSPFSFDEKTAGKFKFKGIINGAEVQMIIEETDFNLFSAQKKSHSFPFID